MTRSRYIKLLFTALATISVSACVDLDLPEQGEESVDITFRPSLDGDLRTRAIGDASGIDQLVVAVYEGGETKSKTAAYTEDWDYVQENGMTLKLIEGRTYHLVFWAQHAGNTAYRLTDEGHVTVEYNDYLSGGFAKMEELDAFYGISDVTVGSEKIMQKEVSLSRPFGLLNFADNKTRPQEGVHKASLTFHNIPVSFNPFEGSVTNAENEDVTFIFTDFPEETLNIDDITYYYVSSNYLFAPQEGTTMIEATLDLMDNNGTPINQFEFKGDKAITLEKNKKTNVLGSIVLQPETWSVWEGKIPTEQTLTTDPADQNRYIIDEADDVAWLSVKENAQSLDADRTFVMTVDVDMNNAPGLASLHLPAGSTLDGDGHTIKGLQLENAILSDVTDITVMNLNIEETVIENTSSDVTHVGVLVNTLKGSNTFSNIHVKNSSVSTKNGAAGGIIGYISRKDPDNRQEKLHVIFDNCHVTETAIDGTHSEGHFVGLLRGYDNDEILQFNSNCSLTLSQTASLADEFVSPYRDGNEAVWLAGNDYSDFDGWLGNEECYRGTVIYGENRFIPCWDGVTKITPLTEGSTKLIYSPFDLASLQGKAAGDIKLMESVCMEYDLNGASKDDTRNNIFTALSTLSTLDGNGNTIYNITIRDNYYGGFVKSEQCATTFSNVTFDGSDIRVTHNTSSGDAYVGTLRGFAYAKTTVKNVHVKNGYLYGVNKIGGLCGGIFEEIDFDNSSVENYYIENYDSKIRDGGFYAYGECGGLIGMITNAKAKISNCSVNKTTMHVMGQNDIWLVITTIPGRHVNDFIGDIRLDGGQRVDLINNTVSDNPFTSRKKDTYSTKCQIVGKCYKISGTAGSVYIGSTKVF